MFASPESQRRIRILLFLTPFCLGIYQWYRLPLTLGNGYDNNTVDPVVRRAASSVWALAASARL